MALSITPRPGSETRAELPGDSAPRAYGELTAVLVRFLAQADPTAATAAELGQHLRARFEAQVAVHVADELGQRPLFANPALQAVTGLVVELEQAELRALADTLTRLIELRERHDDPWPEGRLNVGIALAALSEHEAARRHLQEAVDVLSGRGLRSPEGVSAS